MEEIISKQAAIKRAQLQREHPGQFVPTFAVYEDEQIMAYQEQISKLQKQLEDNKEDNGRSSAMGFLEKLARAGKEGIEDVIKLTIIGTTSFLLQLVILLGSNLFNEMTVTSALYQFGLILFPEELKFAKTQTRKGLYMLPFFFGALALITICAKGYYELNDLSLLIPALKFQDESIRSVSRAVYLLLTFLVQVISIPVLEQTFYFVYFSGMFSQLKGLQRIFPFAGFDRKSILNMSMVLGLHSLTYVTYLYKNFSDYNMQLYTVAALTAIAVLSIHILRMKYGIIASIIGHMIFNFSVFLILAMLYTTDLMHEGFTAEEFTTKNNNCIDFIFGHNEGVENNLS